MTYDEFCEIWWDIKGWEGYYQINLNQQVRSIDRIIDWNGMRKKIKGMVHAPNDKEEYLRISMSRKDVRKFFRVHRLMAENFLHNSGGKPTVNHIDGNKKNNHITNLEWATHSEQRIHAFKMGLHKPMRGDKNPMYFRRGKDSPSYGMTRGRNYNAKVVLDTETGVFYDCLRDAYEAKQIKKNFMYVRQQVNGTHPNLTTLIYA